MRYGLRLSIETADPVMVSRHMHGLILSCAGPGVRGYLLDRDRIEAPSSDVDVLMGICRMTGHSLSEETMMVESEALFWRVDGQVLSSERRELIGTDGTRRLLSARSAGSHRLRDARTSGRLMAV
jgi:hypothetical protein